MNSDNITATEHNRRNGIVRRPEDSCSDIEPGTIGHGKTAVETFESMMKFLGYKFVTVKAGKQKRKRK